MHLTSNPVDWYAARAGGIVAYVVLSLNVTVGVLMVGKKSFTRWPRCAREDVHRYTGLLTGTFVVIHITAVAIDAYLPFSIVSLAVPFIASYRPIWTGLGIAAAELLLALAITNHYRNTKLPYATWRKVHYVNFVVWGAATLHAVGTGTDRSTTWMLAIMGIAVGAVSASVAWRVLRSQGSGDLLVRTAPPIAGIAAIALVVGLGSGPLHFQPKPWNAADFQDSLSGKILDDMGVTRGIVSFAGNGAGSQNVLVRADLLVTPTKLASTTFQMEYLPSGSLCTGTVSNVKGASFDATCTMSDGSTRHISASWTEPGPDGSISNGVITSHG